MTNIQLLLDPSLFSAPLTWVTGATEGLKIWSAHITTRSLEGTGFASLTSY